MKIQKMFNTTEKEIKSKKFNIFIGISLGNKWFTKENLREYLNWALAHTKEKVLFLIVDKIHAINYDVRNKQYSKETNLQKALKRGDEIKEVLKGLILELSKEKQNKVEVLSWEDYEKHDKYYKENTFLVYNYFKTNTKFHKEILKLLKNLIKDRKFSKEEYLGFSKYFLEEFVSIYSGIKYNDEDYSLYIYPHNSEYFYFIDNLQKGKIFTELNKKLPKEKTSSAIIN